MKRILFTTLLLLVSFISLSQTLRDSVFVDKGIFKVVGQVGLGLIVGTVLYFSPAVTVRTDTGKSDVFKVPTETVILPAPVEETSTDTTIPFFKNNE